MKTRHEHDAGVAQMLADILVGYQSGVDLSLAAWEALKRSPPGVRAAVLNHTGVLFALRMECLERGVIANTEHLP
jgi:hypothetical protein